MRPYSHLCVFFDAHNPFHHALRNTRPRQRASSIACAISKASVSGSGISMTVSSAIRRNWIITGYISAIIRKMGRVVNPFFRNRSCDKKIPLIERDLYSLLLLALLRLLLVLLLGVVSFRHMRTRLRMMGGSIAPLEDVWRRMEIQGGRQSITGQAFKNGKTLLPRDRRTPMRQTGSQMQE